MKRLGLWSLLCAAAGAHAAATEREPLWEAGAGIAALTLPAYRGSDTIHDFVLPVPYLVYHGDFLKADRHGVRGQLLDTDRLDFTISASASPPTRSDDIAVREGMPNLRPSVEFGPELDITLWRGSGRLAFVKLRLPVREAFTIGGEPHDIGTIFSPNLNADLRAPFGLSGWTLGVVTGPVFSSRKQNEYFYSVAPEYATPERPAYAASGGYGGWQLLFSVSKRFPDMWVGAYLRGDTLQGAVFKNSPLVTRHSYVSAGFAISWIFGRSDTMVDVESD